MTVRRAPAGLLVLAALFPPLFWLFPSLVLHRAPTFRDQGDFFFPMKLYTAGRLRKLDLPLWNPLSGTGEPWLANLQSGVLYPPGAFFLLPSPALGAGLFLLFHFAVCVWGMRRFLLRHGTSDAAALAGAALCAASGFTASLSAYWNHFGAFAWMPAALAFASSGLQRRRDRLGLAAVLGLQAMAGSPEYSGATILLVLLFAWRGRHPSAGSDSDFHEDGGSLYGGGFQPSRGRTVARAGAAAALGLLLAAWALTPFLELAAASDRAVPIPAAERDGGSSIGWRGVRSVAGGDGAGATSWLASLAFGPLALAAAAAALLERQRRRLALLLVAIAAAGILFSSTGPVGALLRNIPPLDRVRYPAKAFAVTAFALAALAGLGFDALRFAPEARRRPVIAALAAGVAILLVAVSANPLPARALEAAAAVLLFAAAALPGSRSGSAGFLQKLSALALTGALALAGVALFKFAPEAELLLRPEPMAVLARISGRVLTPPMAALAPEVVVDPEFGAVVLRRQRLFLIGYTNLIEKIRTIRTASPLATDAARRMVASIDAAPDLQPVSGSVSGRVFWTPFPPPNMGSLRVGTFFRAPINPYRPRLSFVRSFVVEGDSARAWARRALGETDWSRSVFLDRAPSPKPEPAKGGGSASRGFLLARVAEDLPERLVVDVHSDAAGLLVLTDLHYPGWRAESDGRPADILRADGFFRAVALTAGPHRVVFTYRPISFYAGAAASAAALIALLLLFRAGESRRPEALL